MLRRVLILIAIAAAFGSGLLALGEEAGAAIVLENGRQAVADLDLGEAAYRFTVPSGSVYDVWLFPAEEEAPEAVALLYREGELVAEGTGNLPALSLRLAAGAEYELRLRGTGRARVEIARHALSRCFALPLVLDASGDVYSKAFARPGDAHWYAVDAADSKPLALVAVPGESGSRLDAMLLDGSGRLLARSAQTAGGACLLDLVPEAGRRYAVRVWAEDGATGLYELRLSRLEGGALPDRVTLSRSRLLLAGRESASLTARVSPEGSGDILLWESSDPGVARVDASGRVTGAGAGSAIVTAYAAGGESDRCAVEVTNVPVKGVSLLSRRMTLAVGDDAAIECEVLPANASEPGLTYAAEPGDVVEVDRRGVLRGLKEGEAVVTVRSLDGGFSDRLSVTVTPEPRRWRALLVGEQNYASTVASVRVGSIHSVTALRSMLESQSIDGARYQVATLLDASRDAVLAGIGEAFAGAREGDVALFYITCHGYYAGGMTCLQMYDGSVLTAAELASALRQVEGDVLAVIDCCGSGGVIGRSSDTGDILRGVDAVFSGSVGPPVMATSRFRVLASAALEQDSYRVSFGQSGETAMATVFARALCEAAGWSLDRAAVSNLRADRDHDGRVTLTELYTYTARRVMWLLELSGRLNGEAGRYAQTVQVWPEGDGLVVMGR